MRRHEPQHDTIEELHQVEFTALNVIGFGVDRYSHEEKMNIRIRIEIK